MKSRLTTTLIVAAIIAVFTGIYFLMVRPYMPTHNWKITLDKDVKSPYGAYYLYNLIRNSVGEERFIELDESVQLQLPDDETNAVYIFIGREHFLDSLDLIKLGNFAAYGNDVFIASDENMSDLLYKGFISYHLYSICIEKMDARSVSVSYQDNSPSQDFQFNYQFLRDTISRGWSYFDTCATQYVSNPFETLYRLDSANYEVIDQIDDVHPNLIRIDVGEGHVYLHPNPLMFANYYLIKDEGFLYASQTFSPFSGRKVYWDEISKTSREYVLEERHESILKYIFTQPGLLWGWYVLLAGVLLFILFRTKRMQKVIPVIPEKQNHSAAYIKSVAMLYKTGGSHQQIAAEMMRYFLQFVKNKYNYRVPLQKPAQAVEELSAISKVSPGVIAEIIKLNMQLEVSDESQNSRLLSFNKNLEKFYKNCK
jgi:hypothetical protein